MAIQALRFALLLSLTATLVWLVAVACFDESPRASAAFPDAGLCIHRPGGNYDERKVGD